MNPSHAGHDVRSGTSTCSRSGHARADLLAIPHLSGSSAIAGFRPHRSHRAALPQWALQDGPEADESSVPRLMEGRLRQWEGGQDRVVGRPAHAAFLASLAEHLPPEPDDAVLEHA